MISEKATGILAALMAPFLMAVGFFIWDAIWNDSGGSAFSLNLFKCNLATIGFLIIVIAKAQGSTMEILNERFSADSVFFLVLSGILGIVIGDLAWLEALRTLGATKVLFIDSTKPFAGALIGLIFLKEPIGLSTILGMAIAVIGILNVSLEMRNNRGQENVDDDAVRDLEKSSEKFPDASSKKEIVHHGYAYAFLNVAFDACGSFLTKRFGSRMNTWEINLIRFGSSGTILALISIFSYCFLRYEKLENAETPTYSEKTIRPWYWLPFMSWIDWAKICCGVLFVTFLTPALSNYAIFKISLALAFTLGSITPIYALVLEWIVKEIRPSGRSILSAVLASSGVAMLSLSK